MHARRLALMALLVFAVSAQADTFTLFSSGGNWSNTGIWYQNGVPALRYPGSLPGTTDTVDLTAPSFFTVTVDVVLDEAVTLNSDCPSNTSTCVVDVTIGELWLTGASSIGTDARLKLSGGGKVRNDGSLTFTGSDFDWTNGTLTGSGLTAVASTANVNATGIAEFIDAHALSIEGTFTYGPSASGLSLQNGGSITIQNGGVMDIQNASSINSNFVGSPFISVLAGGTFKKTQGNFGSNVTPVLNNDGTVQVDINTLVLTSGVHQGTFIMNGATTAIGLSGTPTLLGGVDIQGTGTAIFGNVTLGGAVTATNVSMDSFGSITGNAPLDISGTFTWRGGTITGNAQVNMLTGSLVDFTGEGNGSLTGFASLSVGGTMNVNPGVGSLSIDNGAVLADKGDLNILGDLTIGSDNANNARIDVLIGKTLDKTTGAGTAVIDSLVNNAGTVNSFSGALKLTGGGTHNGTFNTGTTAGIAFDGLHVFNTGSAFSGTGTFALFGTGTMDIAVPVTIPAAASFQQIGGTLTGGADFRVDGPFLWTGGSQQHVAGAGETHVYGNTQIASTTTTIYSNRDFRNFGTLTYNPTPGFELTVDSIFENTASGTFNYVGDPVINGSGSFVNNGAINKSTGTGTAMIHPAFVGAGTLNISSGSIALKSATDFGTVNFGGATNKLIVVSGGTGATVTTPPAFNGNGALRLEFSLHLAASMSLDNLELVAGGSVGGAGNLSIQSSLLWTAGTMSGTGTTTIASSATVDATAPTAALSIFQRTFDNEGTFNWNGTSHPLQLSSATLINLGTFDAQGSGMITTFGGGTITNLGTFKKSGGTSGTNVGVPITNSGTISSQAGGQSLILAGGGSMTAGALDTSAGALLDFFGGTFTVSGGAFSGSGMFRVNGGTLDVDINATFPAGSTLEVQSGTLSIDASKTVQVFNVFNWTGGTVSGPGTLRVFGGSIGNSAPTTLANDATLTIPAASFSYSGNFVNKLTIADTSNLNIETGGAFNMTADGQIAGASTASITYAGSFQKTGGGASTQIHVPLSSSSGTAPLLGVDTGTLEIWGGATIGHGTIDIASGSTLALAGGNVAINLPVTVSGTGTFRVAGAAVNLTANLNFNGPFEVSLGSIAGTNILVSGGGTWSGGTIGNFLNIQNSTFGVTNATAKTLPNGMVASTGSTVILFAGSLSIPTGTADHSGAFQLHSGTELSFGGSPTFNTSSSFTGAGSVKFNGTTFGVSGNYNVGGTTTLLSGALAFNAGPDAVTGRADLTGGIILLNRNFRITNVAPVNTWTATNFNGTGTLILEGNMDVNATGVIQMAAPMIVNFGRTLNVNSGGFTLDNVTATNNGTVNINTNHVWDSNNGAFNNNGTFKVNGVLSTFKPSFTNANLLEIVNGTLNFTQEYAQNAGTTKLNPGTLGAPGVILIGGSLIGNGTINSAVASGAVVSPGLSGGLITINGSYNQSLNGTLNIEIGGTAAGTQYDQLDVNGMALFRGTINVTLIGGFTPMNNDVFDLVTYDTRFGSFDVENIPTFPGGFFHRSDLPTAYRLTAVSQQANLELDETDSGDTYHGQPASFTFTVTNNGPDPASAVTLTANVIDGTVTSVTSSTGTCSGTTSASCNLGILASGQSATVTINVTADTPGTMVANASVASSTFDPATNNNSRTSTIFVAKAADVAVTKTGPLTAQGGDIISYTITVTNNGPDDALGVDLFDPLPQHLTFISNSGACTSNFPCFLGSIPPSTTKTITSLYSVGPNIAGGSITNTANITMATFDPNPANNSASATTLGSCPNVTPANLAPAGGTAPRNGVLSWDNMPGTLYEVFFGPAGSGCQTFAGTSSTGTFAYSDLTGGASYEWRVRATFGACETVSSPCMTFTAQTDCFVPVAPVARVVGQTTSAKTYEVEWDVVAGATRYEVDEATNEDFTNATTFSVNNGLSKSFKHDVNAPGAFFYRVRAFTDCTTEASAYSLPVRVVIIPVTPQAAPSSNVPAGSEELVVQQVFIPGTAGITQFYTATTDRPWLTVQPPSGTLPPDGVTLNVTADPGNLPNGTFTATVIVTITGGTLSSHGTVSVPVSINLVTPVTPVPSKPSTAEYALIIPAVGHASGLNSQWQSDVRITNAGFRAYRYRLTFTPSGGTAQGVKQTDITVDAGATTALDDIVRNWYGLGTLGDGTTGMLEIVPIDDPVNASKVTVASSRTYNVTAKGTLGEFMPAVPFRNFVGKTLPGAFSSILSMQQVAQNDRYRTNVGLAEAAGLPANVLVSVFSNSGAKLLDFPKQLSGGQQLQLNALLAQHNINADDARIEVQVTGGDGKVTAYASVIDGASGDPLLVRGTPLSQNSVSRYVLPGVANVDTGFAKWRSDVRIFNYGAASQPATLTFFPIGSAPRTATITANAGQVLALDNVVKTLFGGDNLGGVIHLDTEQASSFVVTGRTYNETANGSFGQFIPAVTVAESAGAADARTLHILQVEDSVRHRTNIGIAEVTGQPAVVELMIILPDSKITPVVEIPLAANEFRQFAPIRELALGNVYNARVTIRVISGSGRVTAYGAVIDELTGDPTYVPAQ
jgi:uncharacterized repeat protein (TIGR01451 family)